MSTISNFFKKYRMEITVITVLLLIPVLEPVFEIIVKSLFATGNVVGSWVRMVSETGSVCW